MTARLPAIKELNEDEAKNLLHPMRLNLLKVLSKRPMYLREAAAVLGEREQKIYYHASILSKCGLIRQVKVAQKRGAVAKYFATDYDGIYLPIRRSLTSLLSEMGYIPFPLDRFMINGSFKAKMIVGSPDPHGRFKHRARDAYIAANLAYVIGALVGKSNAMDVLLDVDNSLRGDENIILVGGPVSNVLTDKINRHLPVSFDIPKHSISSTPTGRTYTDETTGLIELIKNPSNLDRYVLVIGGLTLKGTLASVLAFQQYILGGKVGAGEEAEGYGLVVLGVDMDGDGKVDSYDVLEEEFF